MQPFSGVLGIIFKRRVLPIHAKEYLTEIYSADKRLNEVYDWFIGTFR
ncbi:MAG: hypothetical protein J6A19_13595 [Oscillospiraceae bacterium]|nr:hypothetical protein [Oscillospiraceae bacterium]